MYKVRFHLAHGENYRKWQVLCEGNCKYYDPDSVSLVMEGCKLHNNPKIAKSINKGANKSVCAWVSCSKIKVKRPQSPSGKQISYNPRIIPYWCDCSGNNLDGLKVSKLLTNGRMIFFV